MTAIYQGTFCWKNGKRYDFPLSYIFDCPGCELVIPATTEEGARTLAITHSVNAGHSVLLDALTSGRVDEGMVRLARSIAAKVGAA